MPMQYIYKVWKLWESVETSNIGIYYLAGSKRFNVALKGLQDIVADYIWEVKLF